MHVDESGIVRIALVVHDYYRLAGHSRYVVELAERFALDHEVHVFSNRIKSEGTAPIHFHRVPAIRATALATILTFPIPATIAIGRGFDIIHAQGLTCFGANVVTAHICNRTWYDSRLASNDSIRVHERVFASIVNRAEAALFKWSSEAEVIAVSNMVARDLREAYGRTDRVSRIYHGIDLKQFSPENRSKYRASLRRDLGIPEAQLVALWVGDLRKGALTAIDAVAKAPAWRALFVSRNPPDLYRKHARLRGVSERVTFASHSPNIERFYAAADAFIFPSAYDAFGMVVTEAMASGLPVLVSRAAGASELVEEGESGHILASSTDGAEPAGWLNAWASHPAELIRMGRAAHNAVRTYSWDNIAAQTLRVYERVLGRARLAARSST